MLQELVGLRVVKAEFVEDYLQVWFQNGACLNVYNKHRVDRDPVGTTVTEIRKDDTLIRLKFSNALELSIDMSEDGYLGPEALQLIRPGFPAVVWRIDD